ncbi:unnamed protein product, partial [Scytosiphon promiscuus]
MQENSPQTSTALPSRAAKTSSAAAEAAAGKENAVYDPAPSKTDANKARGVGPRSGLKKNPPKVAVARIAPLAALDPPADKSSGPRARPAASRPSSGTKAAVGATRGPATEAVLASAQLERVSIADSQPKKDGRRQNQQSANPAAPLPRRGPLFRVSNCSGGSS